MKYRLRESGEVLNAARCNATLRVDRGQRIASANQQLMCDAKLLEACRIKTTIIVILCCSTELNQMLPSQKSSQN